MADPGGFYKKFLLFTIGAVCLLILVGGIVRSTGSGMGCPDWPRCFGNWVPPTDISDLPADYKDVYAQKRHQKNLRLANYLEYLGFDELVNKLRKDPTILVEESFNPTKTWIEYLNRLLGVLVGFLITLNVYFSFQHRSSDTKFLTLSISNLLLVGFQGWVGSIVVSTNLLGGLITFHMILALLILAVLIYNFWLTENTKTVVAENRAYVKKVFVLMVISITLFTIQVVFGTQVREGVDSIASQLGDLRRSDWIEGIGLSFYIHRSYSIVILISHLYVCFLASGILRESRLVRMIYLLVFVLLLEVLSGVIMAYFSIPPALQPIHLILATLIFSIDFYLLLEIKRILNSEAVTPQLIQDVE